MHPEARPRTADESRRSAAPTRPGARPGNRPRPLPLIVVALIVVLIGIGLGWMGRIADAGAFRGGHEFSRLGGPWLVGAYLAGAACAWRRGSGGLVGAILGGAVAIALGSLAYYGIYVLLQDGDSPRRALKLGVGWASAGLVIGGVVGGLGGLLTTRSGGRARVWLQGASVGTLGGLLMGEAIALLWVWDSLSLRAVAVLQGLAGAALVLFTCLGRPWRWIVGALAAAAVTATVAPIATTLVREALRSIGWAGA